MQKLKMQSSDLTQSNIEKIAELFPNCVTEIKSITGGQTPPLRYGINFDKLRQELADEVIDSSEESYDFTWVGKNEALVKANTPIRKTLRPCIEESKNFESTENLYIEGDNLDVLKLLQESYLNKVKMIYIDPPYNTGKDFIYKDNFHQSQDEYDEESGMYDEEGNALFAQNNEANPRFHSDWCSMIYPRLKLARNLLTDDGVIFISIDDNEVHNLRKICDEVFGADNFVVELVWQKKTGASDARFIATITEYIIVYSKSISNINNTFTKNIESYELNRYKYKDKYFETRGPYYIDNLDRGGLQYSDSLNYGIECPDGTVTFPNGRTKYNNDGWIWKWSKKKVEWAKENEFIEFRKSTSKKSSWAVCYKNYLLVDNEGNKIERAAPHKNLIYGVINANASNDMKNLFASNLFNYSKPVGLLKIFISYVNIKNNDIILDFFSGSATTAHAVMQLNAEDGGNRKFIMVQLPEMCEEKSEANKAGYKNICEIGKERIRRAGEKIKETNPLTTQDLDIGFRVLKIDETNMKNVYYGAGELPQDRLDDMVSNIKNDRTDLDLLYGVLLDWGLELSSKHEIMEIEGIRVHNYDNLSLVACFEENISENVIREIAKMQPLRVVFRDSSFANSPDKINLTEIFKITAPNTSIRVI